MSPFYVCVVFNRCFYFSNVIKFDAEKYDREFVNKLNANVANFDGNYCICKTCDTNTSTSILVTSIILF